MTRLLAVAALAIAFAAAPATPASAAPCGPRPCVCWDCLDGPFVGCSDLDPYFQNVCV